MPPTPPPRSRSWCFTWNNYGVDWAEKLQQACALTGVGKWVYQQEVCPTTGTPHIQGVIQFAAQKTSTAWQPTWTQTLGVAIHYEVCRDFKSSCVYCSKADSAVGSTVTNIPRYARKQPVDRWNAAIAPQWQKDLIAVCEGERHPRKVYWYWSKDGGKGKSLLARHLVLTRPGTLLMSGSPKDIKYGIAAAMARGEEPETIIWDLPRSQTVPAFGGLEEVKNGTFYSSKYESGMVKMSDSPHVIVLSNYAPDQSQLSADRWVVVEIDGDE